MGFALQPRGTVRSRADEDTSFAFGRYSRGGPRLLPLRLPQLHMLKILGIALAFAVSAGVIRLMLGSGLAARLLDRPNERSLHVRPVPRSGGLGVMAGVACSAATMLPSSLLWLLPAAALCALSLVDDWRFGCSGTSPPRSRSRDSEEDRRRAPLARGRRRAQSLV
jgi:hypothetical protein